MGLPNSQGRFVMSPASSPGPANRTRLVLLSCLCGTTPSVNICRVPSMESSLYLHRAGRGDPCQKPTAYLGCLPSCHGGPGPVHMFPRTKAPMQTRSRLAAPPGTPKLPCRSPMLSSARATHTSLGRRPRGHAQGCQL